MFGYIWPLALIVISNTVYQICTKDVPDGVSPFASLAVSYFVGSIVCIVLHFIFRPGESMLKNLGLMNWTSWALGIVIVGLEVGWIFAYKAGWEVSIGSIVQSVFLAAALVFVGALLYHEKITWNKIVGIVVCLAGLVFFNINP